MGLFTHRVVLKFAVVHVDDVGADAVQEVLGVGYQHKDPLEPVATRKLLKTKLGKEILFNGDRGLYARSGKSAVKQLQPTAVSKSCQQFSM